MEKILLRIVKREFRQHVNKYHTAKAPKVRAGRVIQSSYKRYTRDDLMRIANEWTPGKKGVPKSQSNARLVTELGRSYGALQEQFRLISKDKRGDAIEIKHNSKVLQEAISEH